MNEIRTPESFKYAQEQIDKVIKDTDCRFIITEEKGVKLGHVQNKLIRNYQDKMDGTTLKRSMMVMAGKYRGRL
jgi:adenylyl- and sulfurtransferase ThiI